MLTLLFRLGRPAMVLTALAVVAVVLSLGVGVRPIAPAAVWDALTGGGGGGGLDGVDRQVVLGQRLPRTLVGLAAGAALGVAGLLAQAVTRNPLADPGLLGLNAGAALGIVVAATAFGITSPAGALGFALAGGALAVVLVFVVGAGRPVHLALAGACVTALLVPVSTLLLLRDVDAFEQLRSWSVGALTTRDAADVASLAPLLAVGVLVAVALAPRLDGLALGDDVARGHGQSVGLTRAAAALAIVLLAASATALAGPIALVGLAVPHAARRLVGLDHRRLVAVCALLGAVMLLLADVLGRLVRPGELEAGVVAALLGAPVLLAVARGRRVVGL